MKRKFRVLKARGGKDASSDDFGSPSGKSSGRDTDFQQRGMSKADYDKSKQGQNFGGRTKNVTVNKGPDYFNTRPLGLLTPVSYTLATTAINFGKKKSFDTKNLKAQRKVDVLGGEMLTTGSTGPTGNTKGGGGPSITPTQPIQPIATQPIATTKKIDQNLISPKDNFFNFVSYKVGGLSGGVSYGPPPKRGPNSQVPPIKMKRGGYKK